MKFLTWILLMCSMACTQARQADLILKGSLKGSDHQTYIQVPFDVPASTQRITVEFEYTGKQERSVIDLGLLGPDDRVLGWSGGNKSNSVICNSFYRTYTTHGNAVNSNRSRKRQTLSLQII
jgi:hypothetical protein